MVCKRIVLNAIAWLTLYGFLDKLRRIVPKTGLLGHRVRQTSNAYALRFPKGLGGLAVNVFGLAPECHNCTPSESNSPVKKELSDEESDADFHRSRLSRRVARRRFEGELRQRTSKRSGRHGRSVCENRVRYTSFGSLSTFMVKLPYSVI